MLQDFPVLGDWLERPCIALGWGGILSFSLFLVNMEGIDVFGGGVGALAGVRKHMSLEALPSDPQRT